MLKYREHKLKILRYAKKYLFLLAIPIIRVILAYSKFHFTFKMLRSWLRGSLIDIGILFLILIFGFLEWYNSYYVFNESEIVHHFGIFVKGESIIKSEKTVSVIAVKSIYLRPFKAARLYIDTCAGNISNSDMRLLIKYKDLEELKKTLPIFKRTKSVPPGNKPKFLQIILFSMFFSSTFSGTVYLIAFFIEGGRSSLQAIEEFKVREQITVFSESVSKKIHFIPSIVITVVTLLIILWLISFIANVIRYFNFQFYKRGKNIKVNYGIFTKNEDYIDSSKINYVDLTQSMIMKLKFFNFMSVTFRAPGYGNKTTQIPVFIPILSKEKLKDTLSIFLSDYSIKKNINKPHPEMFWQFMWQPVTSGLAVLAAGIIINKFFSVFSHLIFFTVLMMEIPLAWLTLIRIFAIFSTGVGTDGDNLTLRYSRGFHFHTILSKLSKVVRVEIRQTIFQRPVGVCTIYFMLEERSSKWHKIYGMKINEAKKIERLIKKYSKDLL